MIPTSPVLASGERIRLGRLVFVTLALIMVGWYWILVSAILDSPGAPVSGDAQSFWNAALRSHWFYDSGEREPLFPFLVKGASLLGANGVFAVRAVCAASSILCLIALLAIGYFRSGFLVGLLAGLLWVFTPSILHYSAQGDRLTLTACLLVTYAFLLFESKGTRFRTPGLIISGAALSLLRLDMLWVVILGAVIQGVAKWNDKAEVKRMAFFTGSAILLFLPYAVTEYLRTGQPLYASGLAARYWANREFWGPGGLHQSFAEVLSDPYRGGYLSPIQYVFGMHTPGEIVLRFISGYWLLFTSYFPRFALPWAILWPLASLGLFSRWSKEGKWQFLFVLAIHLPFAFIYPLDQIGKGSGVESRFALFSSPLLYLWVGEGVKVILEQVLHLVHKRGGG